MNLCAKIKARLSLRDVGALVGIDFPRDGEKFRSKLRDDNSPSCSIKGNLYTDWSLGIHLDQIDFYAAAKGITRRDAILTLTNLIQFVGEIPQKQKPTQSQTAQEKKPAKEQKRSSWPDFEVPSSHEINQIAKIRKISPEGVSIAADRGLLFTVSDRGHRAYVVTDSTRLNARIRRIDGGLWYNNKKSMPPTGGGQENSWPLGILEVGNRKYIALVEGETDLLALLHLAWCEGIDDLLAPVAMLGAGEAILSEALPLFSGKRVRLFQDNDRNRTGEMAVERWGNQLHGVGADVDAFEFSGLIRSDGQPVKDLNDFALICVDEWESKRETLNSTFNFIRQSPLIPAVSAMAHR